MAEQAEKKPNYGTDTVAANNQAAKDAIVNAGKSLFGLLTGKSKSDNKQQ